MNEDKQKFYDQYLNRTHSLGRIATVSTLLMLLGAPFAIGAYLGGMPDFGAFLKGFLAIGIVYFVSCVVEYFIYVPMLGSGGSYLAFITGNLINMKIPCAITARDMVGAKSGTAENEIISTLSIATSSLVTIVVLAVGVMLMIPLQPVLQSPVLAPAFANVVPALFGAMACKYYKDQKLIAAVTLLAMTLLFTLVPSLASSVSFMIIPSGAIAIGLALYRYVKKQKKEAEA